MEIEAPQRQTPHPDITRFLITSNDHYSRRRRQIHILTNHQAKRVSKALKGLEFQHLPGHQDMLTHYSAGWAYRPNVIMLAGLMKKDPINHIPLCNLYSYDVQTNQIGRHLKMGQCEIWHCIQYKPTKTMLAKYPAREKEYFILKDSRCKIHFGEYTPGKPEVKVVFESNEATHSGQQLSISLMLHVYKDMLFFVSIEQTVKYFDLSLFFQPVADFGPPVAKEFCPELKDVQDIGFRDNMIYVLELNSIKVASVSRFYPQIEQFQDKWTVSEVAEIAGNPKPRIMAATASGIYIGIGLNLLCCHEKTLQQVDTVKLEPHPEENGDTFGLISQLVEVTNKFYSMVIAFKFEPTVAVVSRVGNRLQVLAVLKRQAGSNQHGRAFGAFYLPQRSAIFCLGEFDICQYLKIPKLNV